METQTQNTIGRRREDIETKDVFGADDWADTPFYAYSPTGEVNSEHLLPWAPGVMICTNFHGIRQTKNDVESKRRLYGIFMDDDGNRIRAYLSGQLSAALRRLEPGTYVEMTYRGKEFVEKEGKELHQFDIVVPKDASVNTPLAN